MTTAQITYVLTQLGYSTNAWTDLKDVPMINLNQNTNILTDENKVRLRFNTTSQNLELVYGELANSTFTSEAGETSSYTPSSFIEFSAIMGFVMSAVPGPQGTYYKRYFGNAKRLDYTQN
jgi:hypothetical protein